MMGVGFVFGAFASAALCYRSKTMSPHNYWIELCIYKMYVGNRGTNQTLCLYGCLGKNETCIHKYRINPPFGLHISYTTQSNFFFVKSISRKFREIGFTKKVPHPVDMCPKNVVYCVLLMLPLSFYWLMCIFLYWCIAYFRKSIFCFCITLKK